MNASNYEKKKIECAKKIQIKFGLKSLPSLTMIKRQLTNFDDKEGLLSFQKSGLIIGVPDNYYENFSDYIDVLEDEYLQLFYDIDKNKTWETWLLKLQASYEEKTVDAGFKWFFMGKLSSGEVFCAILYGMVADDFRGCSVSSLLKLKEMKFIESKGCDFIQTFHSTDNLYFNAVIIPSLKNNYALYHGSNQGGEQYEESGYVHIRKYFNPAKEKNVWVTFKDKTRLKSPLQNKEIIEKLLSVKDFPGKSIARIENYKD